jgi:hypothetical protein
VKIGRKDEVSWRKIRVNPHPKTDLFQRRGASSLETASSRVPGRNAIGDAGEVLGRYGP